MQKTKKFKLKQDILDTLSRCVDFGDPEEYYDSLIKYRKEYNEDKEKKQLLEMLEAISNSDRFLIIDALRNKDRCVCELEAILQKSQAGVSHHLKILQDAKLIHGWKKGKFTHYSLIRQNFDILKEQLKTWIDLTTNWFNVENILGI